ncbi:WcaI family glycosyltransferase [Rheinheimera sp.]|uniref:WcaI family glycosyltransferase n=1 Tax=Rheinheimera sp. TaxID=1869214 RepID=UPI00307F5CEC
MKFLLYSINYAPELTGIGKYNGELAPMLADNNLATYVLTAPPYYPEWQIKGDFHNSYSLSEGDNGVTIYRCPLYVPAKVTTLKRLVHLSSFAITSAFRLFSLWRLKPDVLFLVQPTLFCAPFALLFCKLRGTKSILHIQDYEIDAMFGLGLGQSGFIKKTVKGIENWLMSKFDVVSSISYSMLDNARKKGVPEEKLLFFPNWADTHFVHPDVDASSLRWEWGFTADDKIVLYSGNLGQKQGLEIVLDAALAFKDQPHIKFVIIGSGAYRDTLEQMASEKGISTIQFKPLQPWELVPQILVMADVHLVVQKKGVADAVLPSKLTNILAAGGHALVTAEEDTELGKISALYPGIYQLVEPENPAAFIQGLSALLAQDTRATNQIARHYAVENINKDKVINRFIQNLEQITKSGSLKNV